MSVQELSSLDWDDVRVFLAFARAGSLSGAARRLGLNHTTIARRIAALEASLGGRPLTEKRADGYVLTPSGQAAFVEAERMEAASETLRRAVDAGEELVGPVRVSSISSFADHVLAAPLATLARAHPGLDLELVGEDRNVQLGRGEADVAVRFGRPAADAALARQLGSVGYRLYAAPAYLEEIPPAARRVIGFNRALEGRAPGAERLRELAGPKGFALRCNSFAAQSAMVAAGGAMALLPAYIGEREPGLVRAEPEAELAWSQPIWLVVRADVRRVARVRRVADALVEAIQVRAAELRGA